jgi:hypothetical protein
MPYGTTYFEGKTLKAVSMFNVRLTVTERVPMACIFVGMKTGSMLCVPLYYLARSYLRSGDRGAKLFLRMNEAAPVLSWTWYFSCALFWLFDSNLTTFGDDYAQVWREELERQGGTFDLKIFIEKDAFSVPIRCEIGINGNIIAGNDTETLRHLAMWYAWMTAKRGLGDTFIPRRLIRVDKVEVRY